METARLWLRLHYEDDGGSVPRLFFSALKVQVGTNPYLVREESSRQVLEDSSSNTKLPFHLCAICVLPTLHGSVPVQMDNDAIFVITMETDFVLGLFFFCTALKKYSPTCDAFSSMK